MSTEEEQVRYLEDSLKEIQKQSFYMKRAMDNDNLKLALDHATEMLRELRTNLLTPKNYYEIYMKVLDELRELEEYLNSLQRSGKSIVEIYEQVQCCANVVPRLYLLCLVGGVYIASKEAPAKDILKDLIEVIKGVQHPMRGLFLRNFLTLISKNKLPDVGSPYEGIGGNIEDAYSFLLQNFIETNRLWVRLQTQGDSKGKKRREKERLDLRILVGTNLVRLSQLEGLDVVQYKMHVLPKILEEVLCCKDTIAQSYLMDCVIQVFPDDFHLNTLELLLQAVSALKEKVNVRAILDSLMERLANHSANNAAAGAVAAEINSFRLFNDCITTLIEDRSNMSLTETLCLQTVLTNFALKCHPSRIDYVAHCLNTSGILIEKTDFVATSAAESANSSGQRSTNETTIQIEALLSSPLSTLSLRVLEIPAYSKLMSYLPWGNWKEVSSTLLKSVISNNSPLSEIEQVEQLFKMVVPILRDRSRTENNESSTTSPTASDVELSATAREDQWLLARIPHLMYHEDTDNLLQLLTVTKTHFTTGGIKRMQVTFPSLVFAGLKLARNVYQREQLATKDEATTPPQYNARKIFHFVFQTINDLSETYPETALKLFLQVSQAADECGFHAIAYELIKEALLLYESDISDSKIQTSILTLFIGTLLNCTHFSVEDYETLITKVAQYCNKLIKKPDQSRMISICSHLFSPPKKIIIGNTTNNINDTITNTTITINTNTTTTIDTTNNTTTTVEERFSDGDRVLECLQRSFKIAAACNTSLFVEILDKYLYYFENDHPSIQVRYISGLIALINEQNDGVADTTSLHTAHFQNTIKYIQSRQQAAETAQKFSEIQLE